MNEKKKIDRNISSSNERRSKQEWMNEWWKIWDRDETEHK